MSSNDAASGRAKVLIIDDDGQFGDALRRTLADWFPSFDFELVINNPKDEAHAEPWEYICHQHPLLVGVISDCAMPVISGPILCRMSRRFYPSLPFILMSDAMGLHEKAIAQLAVDGLAPDAIISKGDLLTRARAETVLLPLLQPAAICAPLSA